MFSLDVCMGTESVEMIKYRCTNGEGYLDYFTNATDCYGTATNTLNMTELSVAGFNFTANCDRLRVYKSINI